jgi:L-ascorbate metabolism protein UlaG (beta-lactamase superfamily)
MQSFGGKALGLRLERVKASPRYGDGRFHNTSGIVPKPKKGTVLPTLHEFLCGPQARTPPAPLPSSSPLERWQRAPETGLRATWLGHSTVLLEIDGARILTDPVWGERASPMTFAGPKRFQPVPVPIASLGQLDAVILSHDHYDHLDYPSILELARRDVPFITALGVGAHLAAWGVPESRIFELDWWEHVELPRFPLRITAAPSQHFSGRSLGGRNFTLWSSLVVRGPKHAVFFSGDTGLTPEYADIEEKLGPFDLIMLEIGAFHPAWGDIHLGPENALEAHRLLGGGRLLPVHWGTFNLAMHAWDEPIETLVSLAPKTGAHLVLPRLGEAVEPSRFEKVDPWWRRVGSGAPEPTPAPTPTDEPSAAELKKLEDAVEWPMD